MNTRLIASTLLALVLPLSANATGRSVNLQLKFGDDVLLAEQGDVAMRATCLLNDSTLYAPNLDLVLVYVTTTGAHSFAGESSVVPANVNSPSLTNIIVSGGSSTGVSNMLVGSSTNGIFSQDSGDGLFFNARGMAVNPAGAFDASDCLISGSIERFGKFREPKAKK